MPTHIEYRDDDKIIAVTTSGSVTLDDWLQLLGDIEVLTTRNQSNLMIVDVTGQTATLSTFEITKLADSLQYQLHVAIVAERTAKQHLWLLKTLANTQSRKVEIFEDYEEAVGWLKALLVHQAILSQV